MKSVNSPGVRDALQPQDNLYTLTILDRDEPPNDWCSERSIIAPENPQAVIDRPAAPATKVATMTVTEKGYCLTRDGDLDTDNANIQHDLQTQMHLSLSSATCVPVSMRE